MPTGRARIMRFKFDTRYALWTVACASVAVAALVTALLGWSGWMWEAAQAAGLAGAVLCLLLCAWPVRPREAQPPTLLTLRAHQWLGWAALLAVLLHAIGSVLTEPVAIEYLKFSTPRYQLAGIVAALLLAVSVLGSGARVRRWFASHRAFQATHVIAGCLALATASLHVVVTARLAGGIKRWLFLGVAVGALALLLRRRTRTNAARGGVASTRTASRGDAGNAAAGNTVPGSPQMVFGRNSRAVALCVGVLMLACVSLAAHSTRLALREPTLPLAAHTLPLDFPHAKHTQVNCLTCHHNFADGTGFENCVLCHQSERADLKVGVEARFHDFCLECHRSPGSALQGHGPVSGCLGCHRKSAPGSAARSAAGA